jgi:hypothetical protein
MGDYADAKRTTKKTATDDVSPHHKPLPKGSDGSKPAARPGQKPKPKKSVAMIQAHHAQALFQNELVIDSDSPTGDLGIDSGGAGVCAKGGQGCFLKPMQRMMLVNDFQQRVGNAQERYGRALSACRLKQVLKKTDELPWYFSLLLGAAFSALEGAITAGITALKATGAATKAIAEGTKAGAAKTLVSGSLEEDLKAVVEEANLAGVADEVAHGAEEEVKGLAEKQVEALVKSGVDFAKEKSAGALAGLVSSDSKETNEKNSAIDYLNFLGDTSARFFQHLAEAPPGTATDAELLALWRSLDADYHTAEMYRLEIDDAIEHYLSSPVSEMGRSLDWDGTKHVEKEVRVAWLITKGGGKRLIYMDRLFDAWYQERQQRGDHDVKRSDAYDAGENRLSLSQEAEWTSKLGTRRDSETPIRDDKMLKFVESEFKEMAIAKQKKIWLSEPETFMEDWDHQISYGVPSIKKVAGT